MATEKDVVGRFPTWLCGITLALTLATLVLVMWGAYGKYRATENFRSRESRIQFLHGEILRLDEVLTMSARMAAATGDLRWELRYRRHEAQLDAAIVEARAVVPTRASAAAIAETDAANVRLVAMEDRAFTLMHAGRLTDAHAILSLPEYEAHKRVYAAGIEKVMDEQSKRLRGILDQARQRASLSLAASVALLLLSVATWIIIIARLRGVQTELEQRIAKRTAELSAANIESALILSCATDGIVGIATDGQPTFLNAAAERMLGRTLADYKGMAFQARRHSCTDGSPCSAAQCPESTATRSVTVTDAQELFWRSDGSSFPVEYSTTSTNDDGGGTAVVMTFRDITERLAIERLKDEFVSTVSHELRTPLTAIRGALGLLGSGMLGLVSDKAQRMMQIAIENTDRLVRLINDILDLERIESGKIELTLSAATANEVMTAATECVQPMAEQAGVKMVIRHVDFSLRIDRDRIIQTLTNLLANGIKFSPPGTTVTLGGRAQGSNFTFNVADQGRGIPADKIETIFERFRQVNASDSRDKGGTGLGLAICRSIVNAHRGRIWAESDGVSGSLFQFALPLTGLGAAGASS